ncbi:archaeal proteasome endopeptidase complex subunit alpha, partial [Candidatus Micrarchaeota archaeon]|nr:archaeal proteasome endopeptidase complex subunit alpha [Candidatus Micrarchaeota archaeon]
KRGTTALGMVYKDGVLLGIEKNVASRLLKGESIEKIFKLDEHIAAATSGLVADARKLVDDARVKCQQERYTYGQPVMVETLTKSVCDLKQAYTQYGGVRPFGAALLITGVDDTGKHLFETDPSGAMNEWQAAAIGAGKKEVEALLESKYRPDLTFDEAVVLALEALGQVGGKKDTPETVDVSFVSEKDKAYAELGKDRLEEYFKRVKQPKKQ